MHSLIVVFFLAVIALATAGRFTLYQDKEHSGASNTFEDNDYFCHNLPGHFNDWGSSINTHGGCVALFQHSNCGGRRAIFKPDCTGPECCGHSRFNDCDFNDRASSYAFC